VVLFHRAQRKLKMSGIKNINQKVKHVYEDNFINIFGEKNPNIPTTGTYTYNKKTGKLIKIDRNIPMSVKNKMEPLTENVNKIKPVKVIKKTL
jgi:hypothetical protein